jgi:hypothetical protein
LQVLAEASFSAHDEDIPEETFTCKVFGKFAEILAGFTAKEIAGYEQSRNTDALEAIFERIDYTTVWTIGIKIVENKFGGDVTIEPQMISCEKADQHASN